MTATKGQTVALLERQAMLNEAEADALQQYSERRGNRGGGQ
jgi:hypothetical protein